MNTRTPTEPVRIEVVNLDVDSPTNCPAVMAYTTYSTNCPQGESNDFQERLDGYAPTVVERMHSILKDITKGSR